MTMTDFPFILLFLTVGSGIIVLVDKFYFAKRRDKDAQEKLPLLIDYSRSLFPVFILVLIIRSFVGQLFVVPSGSLEPTIRPGDYVLVTQYPYGIHWPVWHKTMIKTGTPKVGDVAVFHWPINPEVDYIKRVIGVPGDKVSYVNKVLYINGEEAKQTFVKKLLYGDPGLPKWPVKDMNENLQGVNHGIYLCTDDAKCPVHTAMNFYNLEIPQGEYLMMGDNRDDSDDGRFWGFTPINDFVGKAEYVIFSWNANGTWWPFTKVRWDRIGMKL